MRWLAFLAALSAVIAIPLSIFAATGSGGDGPEPSIPAQRGASTETLPPDIAADAQVLAASDDELTISLIEQPFTCDGTLRRFGFVDGAEPGELISFSDAENSPYISAAADPSGRLVIQWQCQSDDAVRAIDVTATAMTSGRSAHFMVVQMKAGSSPIDVSVALQPGQVSFLATEPSLNAMGGDPLVDGEVLTALCRQPGENVGGNDDWYLVLNATGSAYVPANVITGATDTLTQCQSTPAG